MTKGTAETYWAATAEAHFEAMSSTYQPGERADQDAAPKQARRTLPPLTASRSILDAIAACAPFVSTQPRVGTEPASSSQTVAQTAGPVTAA